MTQVENGLTSRNPKSVLRERAMSRTSSLRFPRLRRAFFSLSGSRALLYSAVFLLLVVMLFAGLYTWLTPLDNGVKAGAGIPTDFNFFNAVYFSIVTISSLGYGDLRPVGISRILVSVEVILGLSSIGVMIAALTSRQLSHLVSRLFVSDARTRLEEFARSFLITHKAHVGKIRGLSAEVWRPIRRPVPLSGQFRGLVMAQRGVFQDEGRTG